MYIFVNVISVRHKWCPNHGITHTSLKNRFYFSVRNMACSKSLHVPSILRHFQFRCPSHIKTDLKDSSPSRVNNTQGFVFAGGTDQTALSVPAHTVDLIWMSITQLVHQLTRANIPYAQYVITT